MHSPVIAVRVVRRGCLRRHLSRSRLSRRYAHTLFVRSSKYLTDLPRRRRDEAGLYSGVLLARTLWDIAFIAEALDSTRVGPLRRSVPPMVMRSTTRRYT